MAASRTARFDELDLIKAVACVVVVLTHTLRSDFEFGPSAAELWMGHLTRFAVPGFLAVSGFLYATSESVPWATTRRRLQRIVLPYLVFTALAQGQRFAQGLGSSTGSYWGDWLLAGTFGPYYYVFVAAMLVLIAPVIARVPQRWIPLLFVAAAAAQLGSELFVRIHLFWYLRNPLLWLAYFLLGWLVRDHYAALCAFTARRRVPLLAAAGAAYALTAGTTALVEGPLRGVLAWLGIYAALAFLFLPACGRSIGPPYQTLLRRLSDASYPVYLIHLFILYPARKAFAGPPHVFDWLAIALPWTLALGASLLLVAVLQKVLGKHSRSWIGA